MKRNFQIDECIRSLASTEHLSDRLIANFIHLQSFLATVDDVYASIQASGGAVQVQVMQGSLQRQLNDVKTYVEQGLSNSPLLTGMSLTRCN